MPFTKDVGRQYALVAEAEVSSLDLTSGVALPIIDLPPNAVIIGGTVRTAAGGAFDSATSDALVVGDAGTANVYMTSNTTVLRTGEATAEFAATSLGRRVAAKSTVAVTWTGTGAFTPTAAKKFYVSVRYYVAGKALEIQT